MYQYGELQIGACRSVGSAEFEIELRRLSDVTQIRDRADPDRCFAIAKSKVVEGRAPPMWGQRQIGDDAWRGDSDDAFQILQNAGYELTGRLRKPMLPLWVVCGRLAIGGQKAQMDVDPIADTRRIANWRKGDLPIEPACYRMDKFPRNERMVRNGDSALRPHRHFILAGAVLLHERVGLDSGTPQGGDQDLGETALRAEARQGIGGTGLAVLVAKLELVLERSIESQSCRSLQPIERGLQNRARTEFPGSSIRVLDVANREMLDRLVLAELDANACCWIWNEDQIAERSERAFRNHIEASYLHIGRRPADSTLQPRVELCRWEALTSHFSCEIAATSDNHFLPIHRFLRSFLSWPAVGGDSCMSSQAAGRRGAWRGTKQACQSLSRSPSSSA